MTSIGDSREVGWFSWVEWSHVRELLYSLNDSNSQIKGINMVNIWRSRLSVRGLPVSVDLTAALVAAYVGNTTLICGNEYQAQMSSAMAIVRFVNGITDQHQTGIYAQSVQQIADKLNIPDWMVDLRHEATHAKLPGFDILKSGLVIALNWLDSNYWEETAIKLIEKEQTLFVNLNQQIGDYVDIIIDVITNEPKSNHKSVKERNRIKQKKIERCGEISRMLHRYIHIGNLKIFVNTLLQEGFFVINQRQIQLLEITVVSCEYDLDETTMDKITDFSDLWKLLLGMFHEVYPSFLELITREIIKLAKKYQTSKSYVNYLLSMFVLFKCNNTSDTILSNYLLKHPSHLGFQILKVIIEEGQFSIDMKKKLVSFLGIFKPVMNALTSKSRPFDPSKLDTMGTEASQMGKEIINRLKEDSGTELKYADDCSKSWCSISDVSILPPMGEFTNNDKLFNLDMDNISRDAPYEKEDSENPIIFMENNDINENDNLKKRIDNLFMDNTVYVGDNDVWSSSTDEYRLDDETAWDEDVDFNIDDKDSIKLGLGCNLFLYQPKNLEDCDVSKVGFF